MTGSFYEYYPPSRPIEAKDGIKAQSRRGDFARNWWAGRWVEVLESFDIGARLSRGRSYARRGQVLSIEIGKGVVNAGVQGSRRVPYQVSIRIKKIPRTGWDRVARAVSDQVYFAAKMLSGEMPVEIEGLFAELGLSLFPEKHRDLVTECSCPDWSNPCKHVAAVYYLLGEEFDRDPFLLFRLRGMDQKSFMALLGRTAGPSDKRSCPGSESSFPAPLPGNPELFWEGAGAGEDFFGKVVPPQDVGPLARSLGSFPFWRGERRFYDFLDEVYLNASDTGMDIFLGSSG